MAPALALDLGSTAIKAARLDEAGRIAARASEPAPPIAGADAGDGPRREFDPEAYRAAAERALDAVGGLTDGARLGIASQRSSFVLFDPLDGRALSPAISWQDRRAADWCASRADLAPLVAETGLVLSPHYLAPKLALLLERDPELRRRAAAGALRCGTLDAFLLARWSEGRVFRTDVTMAARTALVRLGERDWSGELCDAFGIPPAILPQVVADVPRAATLRGVDVDVATVGDQPAGVRGLVENGATPTALVNFGTGTFVLSTTGHDPHRVEGYLCGPWWAEDDVLQFATEGTINAGGAVADRCGPGPIALDEGTDPGARAFCLPDATGAGAPYWRPDLSTTWSSECERLSGPARRRVVLEGLVFRVASILADIGRPDAEIVVTGGLTREPFVPAALASCLARVVRVLDEPDGTLLGALRLARPELPAIARSTTVAPRAELAGLPDKHAAWRTWLQRVL